MYRFPFGVGIKDQAEAIGYGAERVYRVLPLGALDAQRLSILRYPSRLMRFCIGAQMKGFTRAEARQPFDESLPSEHGGVLATSKEYCGHFMELIRIVGHGFAAVADLRRGMVKRPICHRVGFHQLAAGGPSESVAEGVEVEIDGPGAGSISLHGPNKLDPIVTEAIAGGVGDRIDGHLVPEGEEVGAKSSLQLVSAGGARLPLAIRITVGLISPDDVTACDGGSNFSRP